MLDDEHEDWEDDRVVLVRTDPVGLDSLRQIAAVQRQDVAGAAPGCNQWLGHVGLVVSDGEEEGEDGWNC